MILIYLILSGSYMPSYFNTRMSYTINLIISLPLLGYREVPNGPSQNL